MTARHCSIIAGADSKAGPRDEGPVEWLYEYCAPDMPVGELATRLAMTGTEVDRVEHHGVRELEHFVVGRVLQAEQHPDADRLTVCVVDVGGGEEAQIVCGAPNVAAGQLVAVGRPGRGHARRDEAAQGEAARRHVGGDDPRRGRARDRARSRRDARALRRQRPRARPAARRRPADLDGRARARDHAQPARLPRRLRRRARGARGDGRGARPAALGGRSGRPVDGQQRSASRSSSRRPTCARASPPARSRTCGSARRRRG